MSQDPYEPEPAESIGAHLGRALALGDGFALFLVAVNSRASALAVADAADRASSALSGAGAPKREWIDACAGREPFIPLDPVVLRTNVYERLMSSRGVACWVDCTRAVGPLVTDERAMDEDSFGELFRLLNQQRNSIADGVAAPVILLGSPWLLRAFAEEAPDFWSLRTWTYEVQEPLGAGLFEFLATPEDWADQGGGSPHEPEDVIRLSAMVDSLRTQLAVSNSDRSHTAALAVTLTELGVHRTGSDEAAIPLLREAVELFEQLAGTNVGEHASDYLIALSALGSAYLSTGQPARAMPVLAKAVASARAAPLSKFWRDAVLGQCYVRLARACSELQQVEEALKDGREGLALLLAAHEAAPAHGNLLVGQSLWNAGAVLCELGDYPSALRAAHASLDAHRRHRTNELQLADALLLVARIEAALDRPTRVLAAAMEAARILRLLARVDRESVVRRASSYGWMAGAHLALGNLDDALTAARAHLEACETLARLDPALRQQAEDAKATLKSLESRRTRPS
jgi:tetratricopeptide (TPR) repeat protein